MSAWFPQEAAAAAAILLPLYLPGRQVRVGLIVLLKMEGDRNGQGRFGVMCGLSRGRKFSPHTLTIVAVLHALTWESVLLDSGRLTSR